MSISYEPFYSAGAINLTNGSTTFTLKTGALTANAKQGDQIWVEDLGVVGVIDSITSEVEGELVFAYAGATITDEDDPLPGYKILHTGPFWHTTSEAVTIANEILQRLVAGGNLYNVESAPDASLGSAGDFAIDISGAGAIFYGKDSEGWDDGQLLIGVNLRYGSGAPASGLGNDGDMYIRSDTGGLYVKASGSWSLATTVTGSTGPAGPPSATTFAFDGTTQTEEDPGAGKFVFNDATLASVTAIFLSNTNYDGANIGGWSQAFPTLGAGGNRGTLQIINVEDGSVIAYFQVSGINSQSGWRKINGSMVAVAGMFSDADVFSMVFIPAGSTGAAGAAGYTAGVQYTWQTSVVDADPTTANVRGDNVTFASITKLWFDNLAAGSVDATAWLAMLDDVTNATGRARLTLYNRTNPTLFMEFLVTGPVVDKTGYREVPVTPIAGAILTNNTAVAVNFSLSGNDGEDGDTGPAGILMSLAWEYNSSTSAADPGAGEFALNNAAWADATALYIDNLAYGGADATAWLDAWDDTGEISDRGRLLLIDVDDATNFAIYKITGSVVDSSGYRTVTISHVASDGAPPSSGSLQVGFTFTPASSTAVPDRIAATAEVITDWDDAAENGWFEGDDASNAPLSGLVGAHVAKISDGTIIQTAWSVNTSELGSQTYRRENPQGAGWETWHKMLGSQTELDARYNALNAISVDLLSDVRSINGADVATGDRVEVAAHSSPGDGGGGTFLLFPEVSAADDDGIKVRLADYVARGNKGVAIRRTFFQTNTAFARDFAIIGDYDIVAETGTDWSSEINAALTAVGDGGTFILIDPDGGNFAVEDSIIVPQGRNFFGPGTMNGPRWTDGSPGSWTGAIYNLLAIRHGSGGTDKANGAILVDDYSVTRGFNMFWPDQDPVGTTPTTYPPAISGPTSGTCYKVLVEDIYFANAYEGIHFANQGQYHHFKNVQGYTISRAGFFSGYQGGPIIRGWNDTYGLAYTDNPLPTGNLAKWSMANGVGIELGSCDWPELTDVFMYGKNKAYVGGTGTGADTNYAARAKFTNCSYDACQTGVYTRQAPSGWVFDGGTGAVLSAGAHSSTGYVATTGFHFDWQPSSDGSMTVIGRELRGGKFGTFVGATDLVIASNRVNTGYGAASAEQGLILSECNNLSFVGNNIDAGANLRALYVSNCDDGVIASNILKGTTGTSNLFLTGMSSGMIVSGNRADQAAATAFVNSATGGHNQFSQNLGTDGVNAGLTSIAPVTVTKDTIGALVQLPSGRQGEITVSAGTAARSSKFAFDTSGMNELVTDRLGSNSVNAGLGTPTDGDGADGSAHYYIGTDGVFRVSNRLAGASASFSLAVLIL